MESLFTSLVDTGTACEFEARVDQFLLECPASDPETNDPWASLLDAALLESAIAPCALSSTVDEVLKLIQYEVAHARSRWSFNRSEYLVRSSGSVTIQALAPDASIAWRVDEGHTLSIVGLPSTLTVFGDGDHLTTYEMSDMCPLIPRPGGRADEEIGANPWLQENVMPTGGACDFKAYKALSGSGGCMRLSIATQGDGNLQLRLEVGDSQSELITYCLEIGSGVAQPVRSRVQRITRFSQRKWIGSSQLRVERVEYGKYRKADSDMRLTIAEDAVVVDMREQNPRARYKRASDIKESDLIEKLRFVEARDGSSRWPWVPIGIGALLIAVASVGWLRSRRRHRIGNTTMPAVRTREG